MTFKRMNTDEILEKIKSIDLDLVQPLKSGNMIPEYDKPIGEIGDALCALYHKIYHETRIKKLKDELV